MPLEGTFQLQTDLPSIAALLLQNLFQSWGKTLKLQVWYLTETRGYEQRTVGQSSSSFQGLISAKFQNFDADQQEKLTRSFKILPGGRCFLVPGAVLSAEKFGPAAGLLTTSKKSPGFAGGGGGGGGRTLALGID